MGSVPLFSMRVNTGSRVAEAARGREHWRRLPGKGKTAREVPQSMVTDILMAGMSGVELAEQLSYDRAGMKVLFAAGYPAGLAEGSSLSQEDTPLLKKPFRGRDLAAKVREVLEAD